MMVNDDDQTVSEAGHMAIKIVIYCSEVKLVNNRESTVTDD